MDPCFKVGYNRMQQAKTPIVKTGKGINFKNKLLKTEESYGSKRN